MFGKKTHLKIGKSGEDIAAAELKRLKYKILARNYVSPYGEVDIVARDKSSLVFVEVKSRVGVKFGYPSEAVDYSKEKKIAETAEYYINTSKRKYKEVRFDIVEVIFENKECSLFSVNVIKDAFLAP